MSPPDLVGSVPGLEDQSRTPTANYTSGQPCVLTRCSTQASDETQNALSLLSSTPSSLLSPAGSGSLTWPPSRSPTAGHPSPYSLQQRFPCSTPEEPGCTKDFESERGRKRHRKQSCKMLPHLQSYRCGCGRQIKRWDVFKNSHSNCGMPKELPYGCLCREQFDNFPQLKAHHEEVHKGKKGRPPKKA